VGASALALALGVLAYRDLIGLDFRPGLAALESWFIRPSGLPFPLALAGAAWLAARRRERWRRLDSGGRVALAVALGCASAGLLVWARLTGVRDLAVESLALLALAAGALRGGVAGLRVVAAPVVFLALALSPSPAAVNELFWWIQVHTARAAAALVEGFGRPILVETVILTTPVQIFAVIESCASLGVLVVLVALALLLREGVAPPRGIWLVVGAVPLALALNLARVVAIVLWPEANRITHPVQWGILIAVGTGLLALARRALARSATPRRPPAREHRRRSARGLPLVLAGLAGLSLAPRLPAEPASGPSLAEAIPAEHAGWSAVEVPVDRQFLGWVRFREIVSREYARGPDELRLFVGLDDSRARTASPFSSKTLLPGFGWVEVESGPAQAGGGAAESAIVARESANWWVAQWRLGYHGVLGESLRHALALDASPFGPARIRAVVRVQVPLAGNDPAQRDAAVALGERFLADFREFLPLRSQPGDARDRDLGSG